MCDFLNTAKSQRTHQEAPPPALTVLSNAHIKVKDVSWSCRASCSLSNVCPCVVLPRVAQARSCRLPAKPV